MPNTTQKLNTVTVRYGSDVLKVAPTILRTALRPILLVDSVIPKNARKPLPLLAQKNDYQQLRDRMNNAIENDVYDVTQLTFTIILAAFNGFSEEGIANAAKQTAERTSQPATRRRTTRTDAGRRTRTRDA